MFSRRLLFTLMLVALPASADLYQVNVSGTFDGKAPATHVSAPNTTWALQFDIDSQPSVIESDPGAFFEATASGLVYDLNGAAISGASSFDLDFDAAPDGGFRLDISDNADIIALSFLSDQLFSGSTSAPEILTGTFNTDNSFYLTISGTTGQPNPGSIVITDISPTPEPGAIILLGTVLLATMYQIRRRGRAPQSGSQRQAS